MEHWQLEKLTRDLLAGRLTEAQFLAAAVDGGPFTPRAGSMDSSKTAALPDAAIDLDRQRRCGFPEVVFGQSKSVETLAGIFRRLLEAGQPVLATRIDADKAHVLSHAFPTSRYNEVARTFRVDSRPPTPSGKVESCAASSAPAGPLPTISTSTLSATSGF